MPIFLYRCDACGEKFEKFVLSSQAILKQCRLCGEGPINQLMAAPNFVADNTAEGIAKKAKMDADRISAKVRQFDPTTLEDIYGPQKAENIYKNKERAVDVVPKLPTNYKDVQEKFKKAQKSSAEQKAKVKRTTTA